MCVCMYMYTQVGVSFGKFIFLFLFLNGSVTLESIAMWTVTIFFGSNVYSVIFICVFAPWILRYKTYKSLQHEIYVKMYMKIDLHAELYKNASLFSPDVLHVLKCVHMFLNKGLIYEDVWELQLYINICCL